MPRVHHTATSRRWRRAVLALLAAALLATGASCGGSSGGGSGDGNQILKVGTVAAIDSLNPFVAIDAQAYNVFVMEYPQLVQYGPGVKIEGDYAESWTHSQDGLVWTFHLHPGGKWSDGKPLTAEDVAWTGNTVLKYASGPTALLASSLDGVKDFKATDDNTVVVTYKRPVAPVLANLEQFFILPEHIWSQYTGNNGKDLKAFFPEKHLPVVAGGAYAVTKYEPKGVTVFKPNPGFYGPKSHAAAVTLSFYTNATSMIEDLANGVVDYVDQVPFTAADAVKKHSNLTLNVGPGSEVTNLIINSNPLKIKNRELLDPKVKEALEYAIPREQIVEVVFGGYAKPWANILSEYSKGDGWLNPDVQPLPYDIDKANEILDGLGYTRGSDGVRVAPADNGQPEHPMKYTIIVPGDLDFSGDRQFEILQQSFAKIGIKVSEVAGGDVSQAYNLITAPNYKYLNADMATWYWHPYVDPNFNLSVVTKAQWGNYSDTGFDDPKYDAWWSQQAKMIDPKERQALVWKMEAYLADQRPYIQLVQGAVITAWGPRFTGFEPMLSGYCKCYYTSPRPT